MKKVICLIIGILMAISCVGISAGAQEQEQYEIYNGFLIEETENTVYIKGYADKHVKNLTVPSSINGKRVELSAYAFSGLKNLETVTLHIGITYLSRGLFEGNESLKNVYIPDSVTSIYEYSFKDCTSLMGINLKNVEAVGQNAFEGCSSLMSVTYNGKLNNIGEYCFKGCDSLNSIKTKNSTQMSVKKDYRVITTIKKYNYTYEVREYQTGEKYIWIKDIYFKYPDDVCVVQSAIDGLPVLHGGEMYSSGFYFVLSEDGKHAIITGVCENMYDSEVLYVPSLLGGYPVKGFQPDWKKGTNFTIYDLRAVEENSDF